MKRDRVAFYTELLAIVHVAALPDDLAGDDAGDCGLFTFDGPLGWKLTAFYDAGELDYIDTMLSPNGTVIEVWAEDIPTSDRMRGEEYGATPLQYWRGRDTTQSIIAALRTWDTP